MPEVVVKTKLKPGTKHVPQKHGGPKRPSSHSGKRLTKQQLIEKARQEVKQEIDQLQERLTNALKDAAAARRERDGAMKELADAQREVAVKTSEEEKLKRENSEHVAAKVHLSGVVQSLRLDLEWAVGMRKERTPPPTTLRQRYGDKVRDSLESQN